MFLNLPVARKYNDQSDDTHKQTTSQTNIFNYIGFNIKKKYHLEFKLNVEMYYCICKC
jgi:hypothetical protein